MTLVSQTRALLWVAAGASLWGADTVLRRPLTASLASSQIVFIEHCILTAALLPVCWRLRAQWLALRRVQWGAVIGIGWGGSALGTICFTEAIRIGNPTTAVLLQKTQPILAALLARALLGESLGRRFWVRLVLGILAGYLISFGARFEPFAAAEAETAGAILALAAAALWAASTVLGRFALRSLSSPALTALRIIVAAPLLAALAGSQALPLVNRLDARQAISLLLMALVPGLAALLIYYRGLSQTRASLAAVAELSYPATATLLNWVFLGARVSAAQLAGFALLWAVILNLEKRPR